MTLTSHQRRLRWSRGRDEISEAELRVCRLFVDGYSMETVAVELDLSEWTVKSHLKTTRAWLRERGWADVSNVIGLRRALRYERLIEDLEMI